MKKVLSLMLAFVVVITAMTVMPALALSQENIEITANVSKITVKVTAPQDGSMTAQLVNKTNSVLYGMDEVSTPELVGGQYVYTFDFKMQYNVPTSTYKVVVGGNVTQTEKEFPYVNINDKITFYTNLDTIDPEGIKQYFADNITFVPVDLTEYNDLTDVVLLLVNDKIAELSLNPEITLTDTDAEKNLKVTAKDNLFCSSFADFMGIASVADADEAKLNACLNDGTFNKYFYDNTNVGTAALSLSEVISTYRAESAKVTALELVNYVNAFNDATILTIEKTRSYDTLKKAFLYYAENTMLMPAPDMTNINALVQAGNDTDLWKDLQRAENPDAAALVSNAQLIAQTMVDNGALTQTPVSPGASLGSGGTGGGGGSSASVDKPTTPGVSTGIVDKQPETAAVTFSDLTQAEWAREAVESLAADGAINGKTSTHFAPNVQMTREEFVKVLIEAFDLTNDASKCDFVDVEKDRWSYRYIASANGIGLVTGDGKSFNPTATIKRQDMAVIIYRLFEIAGVEIKGKVITFTDSDEVSIYAQKAVSALAGAGVINGMGDGSFSPLTAVTRAQAAKVIYELQKIIGGEN